MTRSFNGTATTAPEGTTDWVLGKELHQQWDDPRRRAMLYWYMKAAGGALGGLGDETSAFGWGRLEGLSLVNFCELI
eukprot:Skav207682  [mRNA]  locus=scaffold1857:492845:493075:- [translate_table: standard]